MYGLNKEIGSLSNLPGNVKLFDDAEETRKSGFVYSGLVNKARFHEMNEKLKNILEPTHFRVDVYGWKEREFSLNEEYFNYKGYFDQKEISNLLVNYKYAILQYPKSDYNNDYCAPLKIYEYLACGCIILSVNKNYGLMELEDKYPGIIYFLDDIYLQDSERGLENLIFSKLSAEKCIKEAHYSNIDFCLSNFAHCLQ